MNILIFNFEYPPLGGGGGVATRDLAHELGKTNSVHIITTLPAASLQQGTTRVAREEVNGNVHIHRVPVLGRTKLATGSLLSMLTFVPMAFWRAWRLSGQITFEVVNAQFALPSGPPAALLARLRKIPFVISFIGGDVYDPTKGTSPHRHSVLRWTIRRVAAAARAGTAISIDTKERAERLHGVRLPITVTHLGLVSGRYNQVSRRGLNLPENEALAISVGRLIPRKGYDQLLKTWVAIADAHLVIVGDGPLRKELTTQAKVLGIADRVHLVGFQTEERKAQMLEAADCYVSAAQHEGFGIVFLEAMQAGLPIVATNNGGHTDFLTDGVNALLVPPGDTEKLQQGISRVLAGPELGQRMSEANKLKVKDFYIEKTTAKFEHVLREAAQV